MTQTIHGHTYENFHAISDANTSGSSSDSNTRVVNMISPYANSDTYTSSSEEITNWYNVNIHATGKYYSKLSSGAKIGLTRDREWNIVSGLTDESRNPLSRHYWSGSFKTNTTTDDTVFTYAELDGGVKSDGFLHLLDPATHSGSVDMYQGRNGYQSSLSVNVQFNDLPAFTWVPLAGVTWRRDMAGGAAIGKTYVNTEVVYWQSDTNFDTPRGTHAWNTNTTTGSLKINILKDTWGSGWQLPGGINAGGVNLYQDTTSNTQWNYRGIHTTYIIYCHDGNGKGMLGTCAGMWPVSSTATSSFNVTQGTWDADDEVWRPQHAACNAHGGVSGRDGLIQWTCPHTLNEWFESDTGSSTTRLQRFWDEYNSSQNGLNVWGPARSQIAEVGFRQPEAYLRQTTGWRYGSLNTTVNYCMPQIHGQILAIGDMGDNADLSDPITLFVNRLGISASQLTGRCEFGGSGFTNGYPSYAPQSYGTVNWMTYASRNGWFLTGKFGNLFFQNIPAYSFAYCGSNSSASNNTNVKCELQPGWVIQPTVVGEAQINEFAITTYEPKYKGYANVYSTSSLRRLNGHQLSVPRPDEAFQFALLSGFSASYNPIDNATDNGRIEVVTDAWLSPGNIVDDDSETITTCQSAGEDNALYIKMEPSTDTIDAAAVVDSVALTIYGLKIPVISQRALKTRVTDDNKTELLSGSNIRFSDYAGGTGQTIPPAGIYKMNITGDNTTTYGDISGGYLKIWVE